MSTSMTPLSDTAQPHRIPYVGDGEDGARRSARIDREEADGLDYFDPRRDERLASAERWEDQAYELMLARLGGRPSLDEVRRDCGSEEWLAAFALLDLSFEVRADAAQWTFWARDDGHYSRGGMFEPCAYIDWDGWVAGNRGGWSSTEARLVEVIASLCPACGRMVSSAGAGMRAHKEAHFRRGELVRIESIAAVLGYTAKGLVTPEVAARRVAEGSHRLVVEEVS